MYRLSMLIVIVLLSTVQVRMQGQAMQSSSGVSRSQEIGELRAELARISARLDTLEHDETDSHPVSSEAHATAQSNPIVLGPTTTAQSSQSPTAAQTLQPTVVAAETTKPDQPLTFPGGATLNYTLDGYYEFNFNQPPGRVNDLRAYDVLSNVVSINQAAVVFELAPDLERSRRYGLRLDLQYGQATDTLQGNPANEPRPDIYRNIFQAYGTYILPVGNGLTIDVGKWSSSLGVEGNYTKDQSNYTRSFYFYFLPFYHEGVRAGYQVNDKLKLNYWLVNGTNQSEPTNGFKDELFGFTLTPTKKISWTSNYYLGQEHADNTQGTQCIIPEQPGLCVNPVIPAPDGKLHIIDDYVTWQVTRKLALTGEGDYFIQRLWTHAAPGQSSAPQHLDGGAAYAQYQATPRISFAARGEYMSDRSGLFSNVSQAIKEATGTYKHQVADNFAMFVEFRRDWTNQQYFRTHHPNVLSDHQTTATIGLVWWYGGKQGAW